MRKVGILLCGITAAISMTGCASIMPDLTEEETEIISEYASGVLLKYDRVHRSRLMDESEFEAEENKKTEREAARAAEQAEREEDSAEEDASGESPANDTEVVDVSQNAEEQAVPATIEEYYDIQDITFQYTGYELTHSYPSDLEEEVFFAMDATEGMQLLVLKFTATNGSAADQTLDMLERGVRFKVSVNGGSGENVLSTMLLNDLQTYKGVIPAGSGVELVGIVEVPQSVTVESIDLTMRGDAGNVTMNLQ